MCQRLHSASGSAILVDTEDALLVSSYTQSTNMTVELCGDQVSARLQEDCSSANHLLLRRLLLLVWICNVCPAAVCLGR